MKGDMVMEIQERNTVNEKFFKIQPDPQKNALSPKGEGVRKNISVDLSINSDDDDSD